MDSQTVRQADRQISRQTGRQNDIQTIDWPDRQIVTTDSEAGKQRQTDTQADKLTD